MRFFEKSDEMLLQELKELRKENALLKEEKSSTIQSFNNTKEKFHSNNVKFETVLESMTDAIFISDCDGNFIDFNSAFATYHKFKNKEECAKSLLEYPKFLDVYLQNGDLARLDQWAVPRALRGEVCKNEEYTLYRKDTDETWVGSYNFSPIRDLNGLIVGSVVVARDITEFKQNSLKIFELNKSLEQKVEERTKELSQSIIQLNEEIKSRIDAEKELKDSEEKLNAIINNSSDAIGVHVKGIWQLCNKRTLELFGYSTNEELIGTSILNVITNDERDKILNFVKNRSENSTAPNFYITRGLRKDNSEFDLEVTLSSFELYNINYVYVTLRDITVQNKAEKELKDSEAKFRVLFDSLSIGVTLADLNGKIIESNKAAERILGISIKEQEQREIDGVQWNILRPDGSIMPPHEYASVRALKENTEINNVEMAVVKGLNDIAWINVNAAPIPNFGVAISYEDITERKLIEEEMITKRALLGNALKIAHLGHWELDVIKNIFTFNDYFYSIFKTNIDEIGSYQMSAEEYSNKFLYPDDMYIVGEAIRKLIETNDPNYNDYLEHRIIYANGEIGYISVSFSIEKDIFGNTVKAIGANQDITEKKQFEKEIINKNKELAELNVSKDKFFSIIAHDLKSPFSGFLGLTKIMSDDISSFSVKELRHVSGLMQDSAKNLYALLENLLEWSRMQRGITNFEPEIYSLIQIVNNNIKIQSEVAHQKEIIFTNNVNSELEIFADLPMINGVFRNLLSNAIKFTPRNGRIEIGASKNNDASYIIVYIKDSGIGMDDYILEGLFNLSTNVSRKGTEEEPSTGLGLMLCKEFIEKHNGVIWAESEEGEGSTFFFSLPVNK